MTERYRRPTKSTRPLQSALRSQARRREKSRRFSSVGYFAVRIETSVKRLYHRDSSATRLNVILFPLRLNRPAFFLSRNRADFSLAFLLTRHFFARRFKTQILLLRLFDAAQRFNVVPQRSFFCVDAASRRLSIKRRRSVLSPRAPLPTQTIREKR